MLIVVPSLDRIFPEAVNNVLNEAVGGKFVDQGTIHYLGYENTVLPQDQKCIKALYGQGEYRLSDPFTQLEVHPNVWKNMSPEQRQILASKIMLNSTNSKDDIVHRKLPVQPEDCRGLLINIPGYLISDILKSTKGILSYGKLTDIVKSSCCVVHKKDAFIVTYKSDKYNCSCILFQKLKLFGHTLCVADNRSAVEDLLKNKLLPKCGSAVTSEPIRQRRKLGKLEKANKTLKNNQ